MMTRTILLASAAAITTFATPALAQSDAATQAPAAGEAPNGSDIVVTGSRIRRQDLAGVGRSEEHTSELQSLMRISYAVFCLKKKKRKRHYIQHRNNQPSTTNHPNILQNK